MAKTKASTKSKVATAAKSTVSAHAGLVEAIRNFEKSKLQTKTYLVDLADIVQSEQLSKEQVVVSLMEAKGIERSSAESQYSRMKSILEDAAVLQELREGKIDLKTAREKTKKTQQNPSAAKKQENAEKKYKKSLVGLINAAKELGLDRKALVNSVSSTAKKNGIK